MKERKKLDAAFAESLLPDGDTVHTFRESGVGADWSRERILQRLQTHGVELSGDNARQCNHGLCSWDEAHGWLFIETRLTRKPECTSLIPTTPIELSKSTEQLP